MRMKLVDKIRFHEDDYPDTVLPYRQQHRMYLSRSPDHPIILSRKATYMSEHLPAHYRSDYPRLVLAIRGGILIRFNDDAGQGTYSTRDPETIAALDDCARCDPHVWRAAPLAVITNQAGPNVPEKAD